MKFWEVKPLSKAAIKRAVKLAKTMTTYEVAKKKVPYKLIVQFCETLDITEEAEPFDAKIRWPKPRRFPVANRSFSRLVQFESAYFGPKIEATRYTDHEPKWLRSLSDRISDRQIEESNFPVPCFSVTLDAKLLDSKPMVNERPPLVFNRQSGKWQPFTGTLREWQNAKFITAGEAEQFRKAGTLPERITRLTPSEIASLRQEMRESLAEMDAQDAQLTPSECALLQQDKRDGLKEIQDELEKLELTPASGKPTPKTWATRTGQTCAKRDAASGNKLMRIRVKIDGVDVPMMSVDAGCDVPYLWLFGKSLVRIGAVFNYRGKDYRVTKCERCKITSASWVNFSKPLVGYRIVSLGVNKKTGRMRPPRKSGGRKP